MIIEFCKAKDEDVIFTKDSKELKDIIEVISRIGTEIQLSFSENEYVHGYVQRVMYFVDAEAEEESLKIFISKNKNLENIGKLPPEKLENTKLESTKLESVKISD